MILILSQVNPGVDVRSFIPDGPTALLIMLLIVTALSFAKGLVVPKPFYDKEVERADKATEALHKNNAVIEDLTSEMRRMRRNE